MNTQNKSNWVKDFFYFKKSKLITFILFILLFQILTTDQSQVLGNVTLFMQVMSIIIIYLFLSILWFAFLSRKHFIISLVLFVFLFVFGWYTNNSSLQKRKIIENECLKANNTLVRNIDVMKCMQSKGIKFYR